MNSISLRFNMNLFFDSVTKLNLYLSFNFIPFSIFENTFIAVLFLSLASHKVK